MTTDRRPLIVVWRVEESCALGCLFCGYSRDVPRTRYSAQPDDVIRFARTLSDWSTATQRPVHLSWLGGEPLQWPALKDVSAVICGFPGMSLGVTTHGKPLAFRGIRRVLTGCFEQITVSVDGLASFHDGVRQAPGLYEELRASVELLRHEANSETLLRVNTVLMRGNIDAFPEFCEEMAEWGFRELTFNQLGGNDRPEFYRSNHLLSEQVRRFCEQLPDLTKSMARRGMKIAWSPAYLERMTSSAVRQAIPVTDCQPGGAFLFVDERGRVSPCHFTCGSYGVPLAELCGADALIQLPGRLSARRLHDRHAACDDCHATHVFGKFGAETARRRYTRRLSLLPTSDSVQGDSPC